MSKGGFAIEQIMYIFLMVVIILVASSFLLKALGIDIFGMISKFFAKYIEPTAQRALVIKIDPGNSPVEVWEAYLTDSTEVLADESWGQYFMLEKFPEKKCVLFTVDENGPVLLITDVQDEGYIYYVDPGVIIQEQDGCNSLKDCLRGRYKDNCVSLVADHPDGCEKEINKCYDAAPKSYKCRGDFHFVNCKYTQPDPGPSFGKCDSKNINEREVENKEFSNDAQFAGPCKLEKGMPKDIMKCNLLVPGKYRFKYGIICDKNGMWQPCTEERAKKGDIVEGKKCDCEAEICQWK